METSLIIAAASSFIAISGIAFVILKKAYEIREQFQEDLTEEANMNMADMFMFVDGGKLAKYYTIALITVPLIFAIFTRDLLYFISAVAVMAIFPRLFYTKIRGSRLKKFESQMPDAFLGLSSSLQAGASLMGALEGLVEEQPAPLSQEFALMIRKVKLGVNFDKALIEMEDRLDSQDFKVALSAIRISREVGGNLTEVMENMAETLRQKAAMEGKIESLTSQGKMQGYFMTGLPVLLLGVLNVLEPEAMSMLYNTTMGYMFLGGIVVMLALGFMLIRSITSIDV
jgi:tight adherence protein B